MTPPTITYGHGHLEDFASVAEWVSEVEDGNTGSVSTDGDIIAINISASIGNKAYYCYNTTDIDKSTTTYPKIVYRYKTSNTSIQAKIVVVFDDASTQEVLAATSTTSWTTGSTTLTTGKTLDHVRLYANAATGDVYYDFILICSGIYTFPYSPTHIQTTMTSNVAELSIPGRLGAIRQILGGESPVITLTGFIDTNTSWHGGGGVDGEYLLNIHHEVHQKSEPWQWFSSDVFKGKVTPINLTFEQDATDGIAIVKYTWILRHFSLVGGQNYGPGYWLYNQ